ncbi:1-acyl-sn-glycerol-3-phosphate acyltransferase [Plebeiibacterium marinum]|uniref:1-acyl-sn-glycerol-3-phosphate acyltransferase n=1 Tax=Plebeiibacterium marinum TaxID=2992111 RepID=A0AAE3SID1_9BACT|nr:1-acyl-sn-glycerol-3-phosphate acyltransferase [Plebeiobacterium marinum]MCW3804264.1 1-acyl-sn-glycerol-3-phosphate acyltransferase [Plebeiobacterium marinum]
MVTDQKFDSIRPYRDHEMKEVFEQLMKEESFKRLLLYLFPQIPIDSFTNKLLSLKTIKEFQIEIIYPFIKDIIKKTTHGLSCEGLDKLDPSKSYIFISNHRDIVLDSAFLNILLHDHSHDTCEIAIGDNLLIYPWITKLVKLNKSFIVKRNLPARQMLMSSKLLSEYIRYDITERNSSIWIAQREGRSKDGDDRTQSSLLKMLDLSGNRNFEESFKELQIVPIAISYEYDPCDYLKAHEALLKKENPDYKKTQEDDLKHMGAGIKGRKGRVHFKVGTPIKNELKPLAALDKNEQISGLAELIDEQIHNNYKLWPGNFIAADIINANNNFKNKYTKEDVVTFHEYIDEHISRLDKSADAVFIKNTLMEMYANPVKNFYKELSRI